jgi:hypothetical protein
LDGQRLLPDSSWRWMVGNYVGYNTVSHRARSNACRTFRNVLFFTRGAVQRQIHTHTHTQASHKICHAVFYFLSSTKVSVMWHRNCSHLFPSCALEQVGTYLNTR